MARRPDEGRIEDCGGRSKLRASRAWRITATASIGRTCPWSWPTDSPREEPSDALDAMSRPTPTLLVNSIGVFAGGVLFLACVPTLELLEAHAAVYDAVAPLARNPWSYYSPGVWTPHVTISYGLNEDQIAHALALVWSHLPMEGHWTTRGVEDSDTGERWLSPASAPP